MEETKVNLKELIDFSRDDKRIAKGLVREEDIKEELEDLKEQRKELQKETRELKELRARFVKAGRRPIDIINEFSADAVKRIVVEMETAPKSSDRINAADKVLDRSLGKPVHKQINLSAEIGSFQDTEVESKIEDLMGELGYKRPASKKLIVETESKEVPKDESET